MLAFASFNDTRVNHTFYFKYGGENGQETPQYPTLVNITYPKVSAMRYSDLLRSARPSARARGRSWCASDPGRGCQRPGRPRLMNHPTALCLVCREQAGTPNPDVHLMLVDLDKVSQTQTVELIDILPPTEVTR